MEPEVEWEYSCLVCIHRYGCVVDWALVGRMRCHENIVRVGRAYGEGMVLIRWVVEVDNQSVALVHGYETGRERIVCFQSRGQAGVERLVNAEQIEVSRLRHRADSSEI